MADPTCRNCGVVLVWATPYVKGKPPVEKDGSDHICAAKSPNNPAAPRAEVPIEQIVAEIAAIKGAMVMKPTDPATEGEEPFLAPMSPEMIEGIWKYAISRKMGGRN